MEKFKYVVLKIFENAKPETKNLIEQQLTDFISDFHTPDHPPYAAMIHTAIEELNEKRGSSEESISETIKRQYKDLPLAHNTLLKHHLGKLCDTEEILMSSKHLYLLPGTNPTLEAYIKNERDRKMRKRKAKRGRCRVGKKEKVSRKHGEADGEIKGNTGGKDEMIVDKKVDKAGEINYVLGQYERKNGMLEEQSQLHQEPSHEIYVPAVDANRSQSRLSSPERPPGFELVKLQPDKKDLIEQEPEIVSTSVRLSKSETRLEKEKWDHQQMKGKSKRLSQSSSYILMELLPSGNTAEQHDLSTSERLEGVKSNDVELSPQKVQQYGRRKKLKFETTEKEMRDLSVELEQIEPRKQVDLSDLDKLPEPILAECVQQSEFCEESQTPESGVKQAPEYKIQITLTSNDVEKDLYPHTVVDQHGESVLKTPIKQKGTSNTCQVVHRRSPRLAKADETCPSSLDSFPSSQLQDHSCTQIEPQNGPSSLQVEESPELDMEIDCASLAHKLHQFHLQTDGFAQKTEQTTRNSAELCPTQHMDETTKVSHQRAKLRSWQKLHGKMPDKTELKASTSTVDLSSLSQRKPQLCGGRGRGRGRPPRVALEQRSVQTNSSNQNIEGPNELSQEPNANFHTLVVKRSDITEDEPR